MSEVEYKPTKAPAGQARNGSTPSAGTENKKRGELRGLPFAEQDRLLLPGNGLPESQFNDETRSCRSGDPRSQRSGESLSRSANPSLQLESTGGPADKDTSETEPLNETCEDPERVRDIVKTLVMGKLSDEVNSYIRRLAFAEATAMNKYIHHTNAQPSSSLVYDEFYGVVLDNLMGAAFGEALKAAAKSRTSRLKGLAESLFGVATGIAWSVLSEIIGRGDAEAESHNEIVNVGEIAQRAFNNVFASMDSAAAVWQDTRDAAVAELSIAQSVDQMSGIETWADSQIGVLRQAKPNPDAMFLALLERWVLERAGDADSEGRGVNGASHAAAKKELADPKNRGNLPGTPITDGKRITKRDLFLDQMCYKLARLGLSPTGAKSFFSQRFELFLKEQQATRWRADYRISRESFDVHDTRDEELWHAAMTRTAPQGDKIRYTPPGGSAKMSVRLELEESDGTYVLDYLYLKYTGTYTNGGYTELPERKYDPD